MRKGAQAKLPASIKDFLAELEDLVECIGRDLGGLEEVVGAGGEDPELINSLFRSFHTIKGLAGMLSLDEVGALAHSLEDLLDAARLGRLDLNEEVMETLFGAMDLLGAHAKAISGGPRVGGQASLMGKVARLMESGREGHHSLTSGQVGLDEDMLRTLSEYEEHRLRECMRKGRNLYLVRKRFSLEDFEGELKALLERLKPEGEVISTLPSSSGDDPSGIRFEMLWATGLSREEALARFSLQAREVAGVRYEKRAVEARGEAEHEGVSTLRSLSDTVRVDIRRLDNLMNIVGELVIYKTHLGEIAREFAAREGMTAAAVGLGKAVKSLERTLNFLQKGVIEARMVPIGQMFGKLSRVVRKLSRDLGKEVELRISGEDTELDKLVVEDMADPLLHLIRNAVDHGLEPPGEREAAGKPLRGKIELRAFQKGSHIVIEIEDDGVGIDVDKVRRVGESRGLLSPGVEYDEQQVLSLLFHPGFSTSEVVTEISGRGVGMDVVKSNVSRLRGMIDLESERGVGTRVVMTLPMTLAIIQALLVKVGQETFAIPIGSVLESVKVGAGQIQKVEGKEVIRLRESILPLMRMRDFFNMKGQEEGGRVAGQIFVVVVGLAEKRLGLVVDSLKGQQEIVIKSLGEMLKSVRGIAGATELGDRKAILVLDVAGLIQEVTHAV